MDSATSHAEPMVAKRGLLRVMTCGSVDDGKSTLIGRLLHDTKMILDDQLSSLESDSVKHGTTGEDIDFALLMDGLEAEREQGITIDVAYRFATTGERRFIIADCPGHEQYTRNMATAASASDVAIVLIDARKGILTQTRRHSFILSLMSVRHVVLAVNKMDLMGFDQELFEQIVADYQKSVATAGFRTITAIPLSARFGDNMTEKSPNTPWFEGEPLLAVLEQIEVEDETRDLPFRMPVQWVNRPNLNFRGFSGTIATGRVRPGDLLEVVGSGVSSKVARIVSFDGDQDEAIAGDAVTITLEDEIDASRGTVLADAANPPLVSDQFAAHLIWLTETPMITGRDYLFKIGTRVLPGSVTKIRHRTDVNTREKLHADKLGLNDVAKVQFALSHPVPFEPYTTSRDMGGFIMIDRQTNGTVAVGMIDNELSRATNIVWHKLDINKAARAQQKGQKAAVLWFTGLSGSGKSTIANLVEKRLFALGRHTYLLDGDNVRHGLNRDLGFSETDRVENIRRVGEVAALFTDAGLITIVSFISPYRSERDAARERLQPGEFIEVFVDTPIDECRRRDPKGLYVKADAGQIPNFTGISAPYEAPEAAEIHLKTIEAEPTVMAERVIMYLRDNGVIG